MAQMTIGKNSIKAKPIEQIKIISKEIDETKINDLYDKCAEIQNQLNAHQERLSDTSYTDKRLNEISQYIQDKDDTRKAHTEQKLDKAQFSEKYELLLEYLSDLRANKDKLDQRLSKLENKPVKKDLNKLILYYNIGSIIVNALILMKLFL